MKKYIKIAIMIFLIAVVISIIKMSKNYTWENDFNTKLLCEILGGYTQCQEDMADESIRFADWINKNDYEKI